MTKKIVFSAIQPTGNLHIGNYLGAIRNWVELQKNEDYECIFCIADYHAMTGDKTAQDRREQIILMATELLALGIDPKKSTFFVQSHVPEHTELAWIFNTLTPIAELERMTQYKDKSQKQAKNINTGLFTYPTLMAADILLYHTDFVPVGEDQIQHVELTRDIGRWFNNKYAKNYFGEVKPLLTEIPKVKSLLEPTKKMSKSNGLNHVLELADEPEVIFAKLKKAVTASEPGEKSPGVENLLLLLKNFADVAVYNNFVEAEKNATIKYGELKEKLAQAIGEYFEDFREKRTQHLEDRSFLATVLAEGEERASKIAKATMKEIRQLIGIR
ncbi:MAG: tryptophan--tRNA ligase [Candidatus Magasanikbacteria bacterium CG10_big_fil_rev_8_21_14_0_10_36_16]|uniref:Tryptophan--tRNA ligase n=1 Tax=Candidatus Magasanikbacteria bacterium CG10_big_fil_rev_8_21_14_0_10_36_16 TaxID=1974645 RepID=A0A2H0TYF4_9BACT|nr:MAG: tryptophan--tRNA ligase [Candidatus Magasanikbacteria bacterium CG10_big_fil_rev_8_21_14_0_10_36_16]